MAGNCYNQVTVNQTATYNAGNSAGYNIGYNAGYSAGVSAGQRVCNKKTQVKTLSYDLRGLTGDISQTAVFNELTIVHGVISITGGERSMSSFYINGNQVTANVGSLSAATRSVTLSITAFECI